MYFFVNISFYREYF